MKSSSTKSIKQKKAIVFAVLAVAILGIGLTIAYNQDMLSFNNLFHLSGAIGSEFVDTFESPSNWQTCQTVPKTVTAKNSSDDGALVRMKIDEYWRLNSGSTVTDPTDHTTSDLPLTWTDENQQEHEYAIINFQNQNDWEERNNDGWYYYKTALNHDQTTKSLLDSVTFNCDANLAAGMGYSADGKTATTVLSPYANATFHVYVTVQMSYSWN